MFMNVLRIWLEFLLVNMTRKREMYASEWICGDKLYISRTLGIFLPLKTWSNDNNGIHPARSK